MFRICFSLKWVRDFGTKKVGILMVKTYLRCLIVFFRGGPVVNHLAFAVG